MTTGQKHPAPKETPPYPKPKSDAPTELYPGYIPSPESYEVFLRKMASVSKYRRDTHDAGIQRSDPLHPGRSVGAGSAIWSDSAAASDEDHDSLTRGIQDPGLRPTSSKQAAKTLQTGHRSSNKSSPSRTPHPVMAQFAQRPPSPIRAEYGYELPRVDVRVDLTTHGNQYRLREEYFRRAVAPPPNEILNETIDVHAVEKSENGSARKSTIRRVGSLLSRGSESSLRSSRSASSLQPRQPKQSSKGGPPSSFHSPPHAQPFHQSTTLRRSQSARDTGSNTIFQEEPSPLSTRPPERCGAGDQTHSQRPTPGLQTPHRPPGTSSAVSRSPERMTSAIPMKDRKGKKRIDVAVAVSGGEKAANSIGDGSAPPPAMESHDTVAIHKTQTRGKGEGLTEIGEAQNQPGMNGSLRSRQTAQNSPDDQLVRAEDRQAAHSDALRTSPDIHSTSPAVEYITYEPQSSSNQPHIQGSSSQWNGRQDRVSSSRTQSHTPSPRRNYIPSLTKSHVSDMSHSKCTSYAQPEAQTQAPVSAPDSLTRHADSPRATPSVQVVSTTIEYIRSSDSAPARFQASDTQSQARETSPTVRSHTGPVSQVVEKRLKSPSTEKQSTSGQSVSPVRADYKSKTSCARDQVLFTQAPSEAPHLPVAESPVTERSRPSPTAGRASSSSSSRHSSKKSSHSGNSSSKNATQSKPLSTLVEGLMDDGSAVRKAPSTSTSSAAATQLSTQSVVGPLLAGKEGSSTKSPLITPQPPITERARPLPSTRVASSIKSPPTGPQLLSGDQGTTSSSACTNQGAPLVRYPQVVSQPLAPQGVGSGPPSKAVSSTQSPGTAVKPLAVSSARSPPASNAVSSTKSPLGSVQSLPAQGARSPSASKAASSNKSPIGPVQQLPAQGARSPSPSKAASSSKSPAARSKRSAEGLQAASHVSPSVAQSSALKPRTSDPAYRFVTESLPVPQSSYASSGSRAQRSVRSGQSPMQADNPGPVLPATHSLDRRSNDARMDNPTIRNGKGASSSNGPPTPMGPSQGSENRRNPQSHRNPNSDPNHISPANRASVGSSVESVSGPVEVSIEGKDGNSWWRFSLRFGNRGDHQRFSVRRSWSRAMQRMRREDQHNPSDDEAHGDLHSAGLSPPRRRQEPTRSAPQHHRQPEIQQGHRDTATRGRPVNSQDHWEQRRSRHRRPPSSEDLSDGSSPESSQASHDNAPPHRYRWFSRNNSNRRQTQRDHRGQPQQGQSHSWTPWPSRSTRAELQGRGHPHQPRPVRNTYTREWLDGDGGFWGGDWQFWRDEEDRKERKRRREAKRQARESRADHGWRVDERSRHSERARDGDEATTDTTQAQKLHRHSRRNTADDLSWIRKSKARSESDKEHKLNRKSGRSTAGTSSNEKPWG